MREASVKVWDLPVRLFHWLLVAAFVLLVASGKIGGNLMQYHFYAGYVVMALVIFRVLWGFAGGTNARFANFLAGPSRGWAFARKLLSREPAPSQGYNPPGGWMVVVFLVSLSLQAGTGLFSNDDIAAEGPLFPLISKDLSDWLTRIHYLNSNFLLALAGVHVAAVLFHWLVKKENLIAAMFTGVKRLPAHVAAEPVHFVSLWRALALFLAAVVVVYLIVSR